MADVDITPLGNRRGIDSKCRLRLRLEVLSAYGGACACCGEATYEFLAIDHINGGGSRHRKETARRSIYPWLRRSGYPPGYRVLCHNCNMATGMYGACPHKTRTPGQASPSIPRKMDTSIDLTGLKFGRLTVVSRDGTCGADNKILWRCACECGGVGLVTTCRLRSGKTRSCGCMRIDSTRKRFTSHGKSSTPEYEIWQAMRARCYRRTSESFADYSEHGIGIAKQWGNFSKFYEDMGPRPSPSHRLTRTDKTRNFEPSNCKWTASTREKTERTA